MEGGRGRARGRATAKVVDKPAPPRGGPQSGPSRGGPQSGPSRGGPQPGPPQPAPSAWGKPGPATAGPQPAPSAWGKPGLATGGPQPGPATGGPTPAPSAWGKPGPAPVVPQPAPSAWGVPAAHAAAAANMAGGRAAVSMPGAGVAPVRYAAPTTVPMQGGEGRATHRGAGDASAAVQTSSAGANAAATGEVARGAVRGKRLIADLVVSRPPQLSKKGLTGTPVTLTANYFKLIKKPKWCLQMYRVDFSPTIELAGIRNRLVFEQKAKFGGFLFDGTMLFLTMKLPELVMEFMSKDRDDNPIQMTVKHVRELSMTSASSLQVLNLILRRAMGGLNLQLVGRNLFDAAAKINISEYNIQLWPGYETSIRQHETDLMLCAEITNKVMRTETIYDIMQDVHRNDRNFKTAFATKVLGLTVLTDYTNKTYRIDDIDFDKSPSSEFNTKDGPITFVQYYKKKYNINIRDLKQPLLLSKAKERDLRGNPDQSETIALVPELCRATGLSEQMRANFRLMSAMAEYTRLPPGDRTAKLLEFNRRLARTPESQATLAEWNVALDSKLVQLPGRVLNPEKIFFKGKTAITNSQADWSREFHNTVMYTSIDLKRWYIVYPTRNKAESLNFLDLLSQAAKGMRFQVDGPRHVALPDDRQNTYSTAIDNCLNQDPQMIMLIVPNNNADRYSNIKKKCCVERPVATQVICQRTITPKNPRGLMSVATKVVIQMNCKLGGAPWMIDLPVSGLMTIGFDVCHDTKDRNKSYGAMVATMDLKESCRYYSAVSAHTSGQELSNEFSLNVTKALKVFRDMHKILPAKILVYRDGVGEGQTQYVFEHEIQQLRAKLEEIYQSAGVATGYKLAFIVVSKRINTRFFNGANNPLPGTVVDDVVTLPERYDFFLVSPSCKQGTVSPTSYNILYDNMGLSPDKLQILTFKMTHLYYNWPGTTRVPAVCQYAHKLAFLVGQYIHQSPSHILEKQLYFL